MDDECDNEFDYYQEVATSTFGDMLYDHERNHKFSLALQKAINKRHACGEKAHVLDIGTGTGLLAMLAVRHGADSVVACEMFAPVASCAAKIIKNNGFLGNIKLVTKHSTALTVGPEGDLPVKANILVSEVFDTELIGEGAIKTFNHAHSELLEENSIVIPSVGTVYCQVAESESLVQWNKLKPWVEKDKTLIAVPNFIQKCPGVPSLFDIQLSQLPANDFISLTEPIPVFKFEFMRNKVIPTHEYQSKTMRATKSGKTQVLFMWWDLIMDDEGEVLLSCAPVWHHLDAPEILPEGNPAVDIPWRDHWMQAVYFLRHEWEVKEDSILTLRAWHDEFSLWFATCACVEGLCVCVSEGPPACKCGLHLFSSRSRLATLNDPMRRAAYLASSKTLLQQSNYFVVIGDFSLLGLILAQLGAKMVYILTKNMPSLVINNYQDLINTNSFNVSLHSDLKSIADSIFNLYSTDIEVAKQLCIVGEPFFHTSLLPWHNARINLLTENFLQLTKDFIHRENVVISPSKLIIKACCVQFDDLWKINRPLGTCMGFNLTKFDELISNAKTVAQISPEPQPLWEYPCIAQSEPVNILTLDLQNLLGERLQNIVHISVDEQAKQVDGLALWVEYDLGTGSIVSTGPLKTPKIGEYIQWSRCDRQGVHLYKAPRCDLTHSCSCTVDFEAANIQFRFSFDDSDVCNK